MAPDNDIDDWPASPPPPPEALPSQGTFLVLGLGMLLLFLAGVGACFLLHHTP